MSKEDFPNEITDGRLSRVQGDFLEGYAQALVDMLWKLTGDSPSSKMYDPLTVDDSGKVMHSYAFDMKDGGRHHPVSDFKTIDEIMQSMLDYSVEWVKREEYSKIY